MMNYIGLKWIMYLQYGPWKDPNSLGFPKIANFTDNAILPKLFGVHIGWVIALLLVAAIYIFLKHTKKGYEIAVIGESIDTARYAGINIKRTILIAILLSGGLCGLVGMIQASAVNNTLSVEVTGGIGYTAIITAWLASLSAPVILLVSILFAALLEGGSYIQTVFGIPQSAAQIMQGIILFFVLGSEFFVRYKFIFVKHQNPVGKEVR
jgi:simple sugar transport system permease protein